MTNCHSLKMTDIIEGSKHMRKIKRIISPILILAMSLSVGIGGGDSRSEAYGTNKSITREHHTREEVESFIKALDVDENYKVSYVEKPSTKSPYKLGKLSDDTLEAALKMVKAIRYIAGLSTDVVIDSRFNEAAQAASVVNAANGSLSHEPSKPSGMDDSLYKLGYEGASHSNIAQGYSSVNTSILNGYMDDSDKYNIDCLGHRRWILIPHMERCGFGYANNFTATYVIDEERIENWYFTTAEVVWPAEEMPLEFWTNGAWSVSTGAEEKKSNIKVSLKRQSDGKEWTFSADSDQSSAESGYFNVENSNYGEAGCIIFMPNGLEVKKPDSFEVTITGTVGGTISYTAKFFRMYMVESISLDRETINVKCGFGKGLTATVLPKNASLPDIKWVSEDPSIATVDEDGLVVGKKNGETTVYAKAVDGSGVQAACRVIVNDSPTKISLKEGKKYSMSSGVSITDRDGIKKITINGKKLTGLKKNETRLYFTLSKYKKFLKKGKKNVLAVTDYNGNKKSVSFRV